jgi:hypothetical protein
MTTAIELRALAVKILEINRESPCNSISCLIVHNACDHLLAIARIHELNEMRGKCPEEESVKSVEINSIEEHM